MTRIAAARHAALALSALVALTLGLTGCAKKLASVDPKYVSPEGTPSTKTHLVVAQDAPVDYLIYLDEKNDGYTPDDKLDPDSPHFVYARGPGAVVGTIFDSTAANAYQILRREANGGYRVAEDFIQYPAHRWLDTGWEAYAFDDGAPSGFQPPTYLGRGKLSGVVTTQSPLTNAASPASGSLANIVFDYQGMLNLLDQQARLVTYNPPDSSNIPLHWSAVAGAAGYWVSIYQFTGNTVEFLTNALPAPIPLSKSRHFLLAYIPAPDHAYTAYPTDPDTTHMILTSHPILNRQYYRLRITAVGNSGEILGYTRGDTLDRGPFKVPGPTIVDAGTSKNSTIVMLPASVALRPGTQAALAPQERIDPIAARPSRAQTARLKGTGLTP